MNYWSHVALIDTTILCCFALIILCILDIVSCIEKEQAFKLGDNAAYALSLLLILIRLFLLIEIYIKLI